MVDDGRESPILSTMFLILLNTVAASVPCRVAVFTHDYEFYTPNEKAYQMKSGEICMPLPQNHVKSVEYHIMRLELYLSLLCVV